jgi:hypothetical protein
MQCNCNGCGGYNEWKRQNRERFEAWLVAREVEKRQQERTEQIERSIHDEEVEAFRNATVAA